jgi:hypothetical protein
MPKQTFTFKDFSGGINEGIGNSNDQQDFNLVPKNQVMTTDNISFTVSGNAAYFGTNGAGTSYADHEANVSGDVNDSMVDLDIGIGAADSTEDGALKITIGDADSPDTDLSWEDGTYDFKYTVCKDLGNGIIEEGPLQIFGDGSSDGNTTGLSVDMAGDDKGKFTFEHTDHSANHPAHMNASGYEGNVCGRVYYSRQSGQGAVTQVGWIHLCDLILDEYNASNGVHPRAIGLTGTPSSNIITIEEPPTSASFEMNAGYPSDVGIKDVTSSPFTDCESKVVLGMITYITKSGYIYRSLPGQPDIFPTDGWIDMTKYGTSAPCKAMYGVGNILCYFTANELVLFDTTGDTIVQDMRGYGIYATTLSAKMEQGVVFGNYASSTGPASYYYFDGRQVRDISKRRIYLASRHLAGQIKYSQSSRILYVPELNHFYYDFNMDAWHRQNTTPIDADKGALYLPIFTAGDPGRYKKIYKIIVAGQSAADLKVSDENGDIHNGTHVSINNTGTSFDKTEWTPDTSLKVRGMRLVIEEITSGVIYTTIVYRMLNKF